MKYSKYPKDILKEAKTTFIFAHGDTLKSIKQFHPLISHMTKTDQLDMMGGAIVSSTMVRQKWANIYVNSEGLDLFLRRTELKSSASDFYEEIRCILADDYPDGICINMPNQKDSIFLAAIRLPEKQWPVIGVSYNGKCYGFGNYSMQDYVNTNGGLLEPLHYTINLMVYMDIFPECIKTGCPTINKSPSRKNITVNLTEKLAKSDTEREVSPHMRMGHFRVLKSERYTNKRFQAVYVKPCMVKGRAETVYDLKDAANG